MSGTRRRAIACVALLLVGGVFLFDQLPFYLPWAAVGTVLAVRRPGNGIGWLLIAAGWAWGLASRSIDEPLAHVLGGTGSPVDDTLLALNLIAGILTFTILFAVTASFPSGRLPTGRWGMASRLAIAAGIGIAAVSFLPSSITVTASDNQEYLVANPLGGFDAMTSILTATAGIAYFAMAGILLAGVVSMVVRLRRATGLERLQLRWVVMAFTALVAALLLAFSSLILDALGIAFDGNLLWLPALLAYPLPPIAIGIAILRYRLYEIDRIISRTVSWAVVTGVLAAVFAMAVVALEALLAGFTQGETLAVAASTLVACALFQPVRRRVQRIVDRRFDRARHDGEQTAQAFAARVQTEMDLTALRTSLRATADAAVRPAGAGVWLRTDAS